MGLASRRILPLAFAVNLLLNVLFLIHSGALRLPYLPGLPSQLTHNGPKGTHKHPAGAPHLVEQTLEPVSLSMVMYGESSAKEGLLALKTVLMHISRPAEFHIICSPDAIPVIQSKLRLFSRPAYSVSVKFYPISEESIRDRAGRAGVASQHAAGYGGLVKTFLHEVLHDVNRVIYLDTDMLFLVDPFLLWRDFERYWNESQDFMVAFPTLGERSTSDVVCTCIMLLDLEQMRKHFFMPSTNFPTGTKSLGNNETWARAEIDPENPEFGDQGLYFAIWKRHGRKMFKDLSVSWDMTHCRFSYGLSLADGDDSMDETEQISNQIFTREGKVYDRWYQLYPALLHFNCQPHNDIVWEDSLNTNRPRWGPFVRIARQYKWVWLNRGDGTAEVRTDTVDERPFWDEFAFKEAPLR